MRRAAVLIGIYLFVFAVLVAGYAHRVPAEESMIDALRVEDPLQAVPAAPESLPSRPLPAPINVAHH